MENTNRPRKKRGPVTSVPMLNGVALAPGELKRAIIGTVVRLGREEGTATPRRVYETLSREGYNVTPVGINTWLGELCRLGAIDRVRRGVYEGM